MTANARRLIANLWRLNFNNQAPDCISFSARKKPPTEANLLASPAATNRRESEEVLPSRYIESTRFALTSVHIFVVKSYNVTTWAALFGVA